MPQTSDLISVFGEVLRHSWYSCIAYVTRRVFKKKKTIYFQQERKSNKAKAWGFWWEFSKKMWKNLDSNFKIRWLCAPVYPLITYLTIQYCMYCRGRVTTFRVEFQVVQRIVYQRIPPSHLYSLKVKESRRALHNLSIVGTRWHLPWFIFKHKNSVLIYFLSLDYLRPIDP